MDEKHRKSMRLPNYDYTQAGGYFVTVVAFRREKLFGEVMEGRVFLNDLGRIVEECWEEISSHFPQVTLDAFVVMPNHVHGILFIHEEWVKPTIGSTYGRGRGEISIVGATHASPLRDGESFPHGPKPGSLGAIIGSFKSAVTKRAGQELNSGNIWQRNYYEHVLRDHADYEQKAGYILANPENWEGDEEF